MKINIICFKKLGFLFDKIYVVSYKFSHDEEIPSMYIQTVEAYLNQNFLVLKRFEVIR